MVGLCSKEVAADHAILFGCVWCAVGEFEECRLHKMRVSGWAAAIAPGQRVADLERFRLLRLYFPQSGQCSNVEVVDMKTSDLREQCLLARRTQFGPIFPLGRSTVLDAYASAGFRLEPSARPRFADEDGLGPDFTAASAGLGEAFFFVTGAAAVAVTLAITAISPPGK
jgi:hypothetical protein